MGTTVNNNNRKERRVGVKSAMIGVGWRKRKSCFQYSLLMLSMLLVTSFLVDTCVLVSASMGGLKCNEASDDVGVGGGCYHVPDDLDEDELSLDSDSSRRLLMGLKATRYITYPALGSGTSCSRPGQPYAQGNGCLSQKVNPSSIGCLMLHMCRH